MTIREDMIDEEIQSRARNGVYDCPFCGSVTTSENSCSTCEYEVYFKYLDNVVKFINSQNSGNFLKYELSYHLFKYYMTHELPVEWNNLVYDQQVMMLSNILRDVEKYFEERISNALL